MLPILLIRVGVTVQNGALLRCPCARWRDFIWGHTGLWGLLGDREGLQGPLAVTAGCSV